MDVLGAVMRALVDLHPGLLHCVCLPLEDLLMVVVLMQDPLGLLVTAAIRPGHHGLGVHTS